jgi:hypothetical protein
VYFGFVIADEHIHKSINVKEEEFVIISELATFLTVPRKLSNMLKLTLCEVYEDSLRLAAFIKLVTLCIPRGD